MDRLAHQDESNFAFREMFASRHNISHRGVVRLFRRHDTLRFLDGIYRVSTFRPPGKTSDFCGSAASMG